MENVTAFRADLGMKCIDLARLVSSRRLLPLVAIKTKDSEFGCWREYDSTYSLDLNWLSWLNQLSSPSLLGFIYNMKDLIWMIWRAPYSLLFAVFMVYGMAAFFYVLQRLHQSGRDSFEKKLKPSPGRSFLLITIRTTGTLCFFFIIIIKFVCSLVLIASSEYKLHNII